MRRTQGPVGTGEHINQVVSPTFLHYREFSYTLNGWSIETRQRFE